MNSEKSNLTLNAELSEQVDIFLTGLLGKDPSQSAITLEKADDFVKSVLFADIDDRAFTSTAFVYLISKVLSYVPRPKRVRHNDEFDLLSFISNIPIAENSLLYEPIIKLVEKFVLPTQDVHVVFNKLETAYILCDLHDFDATREVLNTLEPILDDTKLIIQLMVKSIYAHVKAAEHDYVSEQSLWLEIISKSYFYLSYDCTIYFILQWIIMIKWFQPLREKKDILIYIFESYNREKTLNAAIMLYELFQIPGRSITPHEKMSYLKRLLKYPTTFFTMQQLQSVYYYAGTLTSAIHSQFKDSIGYFQYSNFYMNKCWEQIRINSVFLRHYLPEKLYLQTIPFFETRLLETSNLASMQSNIFVENLESNYHKIEELYTQVEELSLTDSLTGLRNRRFLDTNIYHLALLALRHNEPVSFAMLDLDWFKKINDQYGHATGDSVLKEISRLLLNSFRKSDMIVRYGGEEFLVVLFDSEQEQTYELLEGFRYKVEQHKFRTQDHELHVTVSIGFACYMFNKTDENFNFHDMIAAADFALYEAKKSGRNQVRNFVLKKQS